jgi:hypothetical protein
MGVLRSLRAFLLLDRIRGASKNANSSKLPTESKFMTIWKFGEGGSPLVGATGVLLLISGLKARSVAKERAEMIPRLSEHVILLSAEAKYDLELLLRAAAEDLSFNCIF